MRSNGSNPVTRLIHLTKDREIAEPAARARRPRPGPPVVCVMHGVEFEVKAELGVLFLRVPLTAKEHPHAMPQATDE